MPVGQEKLRVAHHDSVAAVVVAAGADVSFLVATLAGLAAQSVALERVVVAVPVARDAQNALEKAGLPAHFRNRCVIVPVGDARTFGDAVTLARKRDADESTAGSSAQTQHGVMQAQHGTAQTRWLWLLHADSTPLPTALENLLSVAERSAKIGVVGPKYVAPRSTPSDPYYVSEVGIRATRSARRVPETREAERDQGQFDAREDVLAVGSAGMLVRTSLWEQLGGFNPNLGPFGDGLEFSRRVHLAGYRVLVAPMALLEHRGQSLRPEADLAASYGARRRAQIFNALLAAPRLLVIPLWLGYMIGAIPRAVVRLVWRDSVRARGEISAGVRTVGALGAVMAGRRAIAKIGGNQSSLRALEASSRDIREAKRTLRLADEDESATVTQVDIFELKAARAARRRTYRGALVTALIAVALTASINVKNFAAGTLIGGALAPDHLTAAGLWQTALHDWLTSADGVAGTIDLYWLAWLPVLLIGAPWGLTLGQVFTLWLYVAPVAAAGIAYLAIGRFTLAAGMRVVLSLLWIVSPSFLEALAQGRVAAASVHTLLPLALFTVVGAWRERAGHDVRHTRRAHIHIGLSSIVFAMLALAAPIFVLLAAMLALVCMLCARSERLRWLWVPVPAVAVSIPALLHLRLDWRAWLAFFMSEPGVPVAGILEPRQILTGFATRSFHITAPDLDWLLFVPLLLIVMLAALLVVHPRSGKPTKFGWLLVSAGMTLAVISPFLPVNVAVEAGQFMPVAAWHGVGFSLAWLGIIMALASGSARMRRAGARVAAASDSADVTGSDESAGSDGSVSRGNSADAAHSADSADTAHSAGFASSANVTDAADSVSGDGCASSAAASDATTSTPTGGESQGHIQRLIHAHPQGFAYRALAAVLCASALTIGGWWAGSEFISSRQVLNGEPSALAPALAITNQTSADRSRTLALHATANGVEVEIWRSSGMQLHEYTMVRGANRVSSVYPVRRGWAVAADEKAAEHFDDAEQDLSTALANVPAAGQDVAKTLGEHAISVVLVVPQRESTDSQARLQLIADLNAVPGLEYVTQNETGAFWRVSAPNATSSTQNPARLRVVDTESGLWQTLDSDDWDAHDTLAGSSGERMLVLAERSDGAWRAHLDGRALTPVDPQSKAAAGVPVWANAWTIPAGAGGEITLWRRDWLLWGALGCAAVTLLVGLVAAMPLRPRKEDVA